MCSQKCPHATPRLKTRELSIAQFQRLANKCGGTPVTTAAFVFESCLGSPGLGKQHIIDRIDFILIEVMVLHEETQVIYMMPTLQFTIGIGEKLTGKLSGMPMTIGTAIFPQPMQIYIRCPDNW